MRKLGLAMALATTALATPAMARDDSWYVGAHGGATIVEDMDTVVADRRANSTWNTNTGYDVDGVLGYDFGMFRIEGEVAYKRAYTDVNTYYNHGPAPYLSTRGNARSLSFMLNGLLDFGSDDGIQAFIGGGAGVARTYLYSQITDDSDTGFAWQAIAGLRYPITSHIDGELKYRYFNHESIDLVTSRGLGSVPVGQGFNTDLRSHSILAGLTYNFGGEEAAPPPPPPP
ncbi:outer membrane beta-barrel protein, partial [Sphingobium sufflavum]|uniref:outer membrane protein n=1 Tax=Sphingobium sufflavum TaxID=1129547 RepID=UPI001F1F9B8A